MNNPAAFFDCLRIIQRLQRTMRGVSRRDIQRMGYLSCILALYEKKPAADWGYQFANTDYGKPFSHALQDATKSLHDSGRLTENDGRFSLSDSGTLIMGALQHLVSNRQRARYLDAACFSMLAVPQSTLSQGLEHEPTVASSQLKHNGAMLLNGPAFTVLYEQLKTLASVIPVDSGDDLVSPSVLWLSFSAGSPVSQAVT